MLTQDKKEYFKELLFQRLDELFAGANKAVNDFDGLKICAVILQIRHLWKLTQPFLFILKRGKAD